MNVDYNEINKLSAYRSNLIQLMLNLFNYKVNILMNHLIIPLMLHVILVTNICIDKRLLNVWPVSEHIRGEHSFFKDRVVTF